MAWLTAAVTAIASTLGMNETSIRPLAIRPEQTISKPKATAMVAYRQARAGLEQAPERGGRAATG